MTQPALEGIAPAPVRPGQEPFRLDGRVALVTGASRGLGAAIALEVARAGADVALIARDAERLGEVAARIHGLGRRALVVVADVGKPTEVRASVERCAEGVGPADVLVNNAGMATRKGVEQLSDDEWDEILRVNLTSAFTYARAVIPAMRERGWGRIVNIASISAQTGGLRGSPAYGASKGGMIAFTRALARDLAPHGITVNAIAPGQIRTDMSAALTPEQLAATTALIPVGRLGEPAEIAWGVRFLASDEAAYITGATLDINGGVNRR
ncbi:MAG: 3-oxoacyl-ACP reductase FabG [Chloroflexi bacterium]|nr:3-oxoacyl-ACP reductase FabG [Chloroflexota bacterium]